MFFAVFVIIGKLVMLLQEMRVVVIINTICRRELFTNFVGV